jgi:regulator of nucleoside diphosphate kinase
VNRKMLLGDPPSIHIHRPRLRPAGRAAYLPRGKADIRTLNFLRSELDGTRLVDQADVAMPFVRIGSHVTFKDERGKVHSFTLTLPDRKSGDPNKMSVVTPLGAALLGLSEGQSISYETPDNRIKTVTIQKVSAARSRLAQAPAI